MTETNTEVNPTQTTPHGQRSGMPLQTKVFLVLVLLVPVGVVLEITHANCN